MPVHQLLRESVALTLVKGDERINRKALIDYIGSIVPVEHIDSFGNIGNASQWYVILKTQASREKLLACDELKVGEQVFLVGEPFKQVKLIRLLNIPTSVSDEEVRHVASNWGGTVLSVEPERLPHPYEAIKTFVRRIRIRFSSKKDEDNVPIAIRFAGLNITVHLEGRQKVCYRCKQTGHIKSECTTQKCRVCYEIGHDDPDCQNRRSYATVTKLTTPTIVNETIFQSPIINVEDTEGNTIETVPRSEHKRKLAICRRCKQKGHIRKDCPFLDSTTPKGETNKECGRDDNLDKQSSTPGMLGNNALESPSLETPNPNNAPMSTSNDPEICYEKEVPVLALEPTPGINTEAILTTGVGNLKELYEAYKDPNADLKRRRDQTADRSLDSDTSIELKKVHLHDSSTSTMDDKEDDEEDEEGEIKNP